MNAKSLSALMGVLAITAILISSCASVTTTTVTAPPTTIIQPGMTTVLPAVTVTLASGTTIIPATTVTVQPVTITPIPPVTTVGFLPTTPITITTHMADLVTLLNGQCLQCHGDSAYFQFPEAPSWDGNLYGSLTNIGVYFVVPGSIQNHTGRTADECLTCHVVATSS